MPLTSAPPGTHPRHRHNRAPAMRQRPQRPFGEQGRDSSSNRARGQFGRAQRQLIGVDPVIGNIMTERPEADPAVIFRSCVFLAELEEAAEWLHQPGCSRIASPRSELSTTSTPTPPVSCAHSSANPSRVPVEHGLDPDRRSKARLGGRAGRRDPPRRDAWRTGSRLGRRRRRRHGSARSRPAPAAPDRRAHSRR